VTGCRTDTGRHADTGGWSPLRTWTQLLAIVRANRRRALGDWRLVFVGAVLPVVIVLVVGLAFGGDQRTVVGVVDGDGSSAAHRMLAVLGKSPTVEVRRYASVQEVRDDVLRGHLGAGVVIEAGFGADMAGGRGTHGTSAVVLVGQPGQLGTIQVAAAVAAAETIVAGETSAARAAMAGGNSVAVALARARRLTDALLRQAGHDGSHPSPYTYTATANVVLFVFLSLLVTSAGFVEARRSRMLARMLAAPASPATVVAGHLVSSAILGVGQGIGLLLVAWVVFGVRWHSMAGVGLLVVAVSMAATGASLLVGTLARSPDQAVAAGTVLALAGGMLGGCMWPLDEVPSAMRSAGHLTPQAWAMDAFGRLVTDHGSVFQVLPQLGVLAGFAVGLVALAAWRVRVAVVGAGA